MHSHRCKNCGTVWHHAAINAGNAESHACPKCGKAEWDQFTHAGDPLPSMSVAHGVVAQQKHPLESRILNAVGVVAASALFISVASLAVIAIARSVNAVKAEIASLQ